MGVPSKALGADNRTCFNELLVCKPVVKVFQTPQKPCSLALNAQFVKLNADVFMSVVIALLLI